MDVDRPLMLEIAQDIWSTILRMGLEEDKNAESTPQFGEHYFIGSVQISGDRDLAITIRLPLALAQRATAAMLEMELTDVSDDLTTDAVGELTNMVAGSLKNRLEGGSRLSVPTVIQGDRLSLCLPGSHKVLDLTLTSDMLPALIAVHERLRH